VPGTELQLAKDPKIICTTVDDANKVDHLIVGCGSLSDAALQAHIALGDDWPAVSGPWAWTYQGKRLDDLRREIEDKPIETVSTHRTGKSASNANIATTTSVRRQRPRPLEGRPARRQRQATPAHRRPRCAVRRAIAR